MALPFADYKILEVQTDTVSLVIKGDSLPIATEKGRISVVELAGGHITDIKVCAISSDCSVEGEQRIAVAPLFFVQRNYRLSARSRNGAELSVWHENPAVRECFEHPFGRHDEVDGLVSFGNHIGRTEFVIRVENGEALTVRIEVYPSRISYKEDYRHMLTEISGEAYAAAWRHIGITGKQAADKTPEEAVPPLTALKEAIEDYQKAVDSILSAPQSRKLPRQKQPGNGRNTSKWLVRQPVCTLETTEKTANEKGSATSSYFIYNTKENQYVRFMLQNTLRLLSDFQRRYTMEDEPDGIAVKSADELANKLNGVVSNSFLSNIDAYQESKPPAFKKKSGYAQLYKHYHLLQRSLTVNGEVFELTEKDTALLYEYWCFLTLVRILKDKHYRLSSPDVIRTDDGGAAVALTRGKSTELNFVSPYNGETIALVYQPGGNGLQGQESGIVLKKDDTAHYLFTFCYNMGGERPGLLPEPKQEDIDALYRRRDAIACANEENRHPSFDKTRFGAFVLFPYADEKLHEQQPFYKSIDSTNIGGLPFLPGTTGLVEQLITKLLDSGVPALPVELEKKLAEVDWHTADVLVGTTRSTAQLQHCLDKKYYYLPASQVKEEMLPLRFVALYEGNIGIRYYGKVIRAAKMKRERIPFPLSKNNPEERYYAFAVSEWKKITVAYCEEFVYRARYTNQFLLENCSHTYELFKIHTAKQFQTLYHLNNALRILAEQDKAPGFLIDAEHTVRVHEGFLQLLNSDNKVLLQIPEEKLRRFPETCFRSLADMLQRKGI